jgi:2-hydroxychromene-2-carboxylate isomerase
VLRVDAFTLYHSSNAYLGTILAERALAGLPVAIARRPLHVPKARGIWVSDLVGGRSNPRGNDYNRRDCLRWAERHGIPMRFAPPDEIGRRVARWRALPYAREELAARAYYAAVGSGREAALDAALFRASYVDLADVNEEPVVRAAIASAGLDADALLARANEADAARELEAALAEFDRLACPGTPTFVFGGELFWGKDRVDWLADAVRRRVR